MEMTLVLVTLVAELQYLSSVHTIFAESLYISVSVKLSLSDCIFGNTYDSTYPTVGQFDSYVPFASLWFPLQSQLWKEEVTHSFYGNISESAFQVCLYCQILAASNNPYSFYPFLFRKRGALGNGKVWKWNSGWKECE